MWVGEEWEELFVWCCNEKGREWQLVFPTCDYSSLGAITPKESSFASLFQDISFSVSLSFYLSIPYIYLFIYFFFFSLPWHEYNGSKGENYVRPELWGLIYIVLSLPMTVLASRMALIQSNKVQHNETTTTTTKAHLQYHKNKNNEQRNK